LAFLSWIIPSGGSQLSCCADTQAAYVHMVKNWSLANSHQGTEACQVRVWKTDVSPFHPRPTPLYIWSNYLPRPRNLFPTSPRILIPFWQESGLSKQKGKRSNLGWKCWNHSCLLEKEMKKLNRKYKHFSVSLMGLQCLAGEKEAI